MPNKQQPYLEYDNQQSNDLLKSLAASYRRSVGPNARRNIARSRKWFSTIGRKNFNRVRLPKLMQGKTGNLTAKPKLFGFYLFSYDAIGFEEGTLPYFDRLPLSLIIDFTETGFVGINVHYLPPALRLAAFEVLLDLRTEKRFRKSTKIKAQWAQLKAMSNSYLFKAAVKQYRWDRVRSQFLFIPAQDWELMMFLPSERFVSKDGSNAQAIQRKELKKARG